MNGLYKGDMIWCKSVNNKVRLHIQVKPFLCAGATFLAISADYATSGSGFVVPSACGKAGVEAMTK